MEKKSAQYEKGLSLLERLHGGHSGEQLVRSLEGVCPDLVDMTLEWALAGIMGRPGLDLLTRELLLVGSCVTIGGGAEPQLAAHIDAALKVGATASGDNGEIAGDEGSKAGSTNSKRDYDDAEDLRKRLAATKEKIVETILQMLFYAGGVKVSNAMRVANEVFKNHKI